MLGCLLSFYLMLTLMVLQLKHLIKEQKISQYLLFYHSEMSQLALHPYVFLFKLAN